MELVGDWITWLVFIVWLVGLGYLLFKSIEF